MLLLLYSCAPTTGGESADTDCAITYADEDGDGFGSAPLSCAEVGVADASDCDDADPEVRPGASERCNGIDDDCDGVTEPEVATWYADADGDGRGDPATGTDTCLPEVGLVAIGDDCDDSNAYIFNGAREYCDGLDNDCDGEVDLDGVISWRSSEGTWSDRADEAEDLGSGYGVVRLNDDGDLWICPGVWHIRVSINEDTVVSVQGPGGSAATVLDVAGGSGVIGVSAGAYATIQGLTLTGSYSEGWGGGALTIGDGGRATASDVVIVGNTSEGVGGAMTMGEDASFTGTDILVEDNHCGLTGATIHTDYVNTVRFTDSTFRGNTGAYGAARISAQNNEFTRCTFEDNVSSRWGGGLAILDGELTLEDSTFRHNRAQQGGGLYSEAVGVMRSCTFEGNTADEEGGGAMSLGALDVEDTTFLSNTAALGGGLHTRVGAITTSTFEGNVATQQGGGLYVQSEASATDSTFTGNTSVEGGGIYSDATFAGEGLIVEGNVAEAGGGLSVYGENTSLSGGRFADNTATTRGGGIAVEEDGAVSLDDVEIIDNTSSDRGGGLAGYLAEMTLRDGSVSGNSAPTGGGLYAQYGEVTLNGVALSDNVAAVGAGFALEEVWGLAMSNGTSLVNNVASERGGAFSITMTGSRSSRVALTCNQSTASGNTPEDGWLDLVRYVTLTGTDCPAGNLYNEGVTFDATASPDFTCDYVLCQ